MKVSYPILLSFPVTASRLMSAISLSRGSSVLTSLLHDLCRMKASIAAVTLFGVGPIWRHPTRVAELTELPKPGRHNFAEWQRKFHLVLELVANIEVNQIGQRLATAPAREKLHILLQGRRVYANAELVLYAEHARADEQVDPNHA